MQQKSKTQIIEETCSYYNSTNRSVAVNRTVCLYNGPNGKQCAFSRCCTDPTMLNEGKTISGQIFSADFYLMDDYKGHSEDFWTDLQGLHDLTENWNKKGLSKKGIVRKYILLERYAD